MHLLAQGTGSFKRAKHIKARYFWLKDLIDEKETELQYIPSEELSGVTMQTLRARNHFIEFTRWGQ